MLRMPRLSLPRAHFCSNADAALTITKFRLFGWLGPAQVGGGVIFTWIFNVGVIVFTPLVK